MSERAHYDWVVIGAGPAGQKAALQGASEGRRVLVVDQGRAPGGECVNRGTIPSKTLRETARHFAALERRSAGVLRCELSPDAQLTGLMQRLEEVRTAHARTLAAQLAESGAEFRQSRARFVGERRLELRTPGGDRSTVTADTVFIAVGSRPRTPEDVPVDHDLVLDSDSILSLVYLPRSLIVLGAGVIAVEFASIFASLGVEVTIVDRYPHPIGFMDEELCRGFVRAFRARGGRFLGATRYTRVSGDGLGGAVVELESGEVLRAEKVLAALGRVANLQALALEATGLAPNVRGHLAVGKHGETAVPGIYACGDVVGPPALASTSMEQGRRAARHALGRPVSDDELGMVPCGIYTLPELASVGLTEADARAKHGAVLVGRASFGELARGMIEGAEDGFLKLVVDPSHARLLGCHVLGDGAAELVHVAEVAMLGGLTVDTFVERTFNFPTLAEAYRVAALDVLAQRAARTRAA